MNLPFIPFFDGSTFLWAKSLLFSSKSSLILPRQENPNVVVNVLPIWFDSATIEWTIPSSWGKCTFNVYSGEADGAEFSLLNKDPLSDTFYKDSENRDFDKYHATQYRVEVVLPNGQSVWSPSSDSSLHRRDIIELRSKDIQRRAWILLTKFVGVKSFLFKKKSHGEYCPSCRGERSEKIFSDRCPICFGTGFNEGYSSPIQTYLQYDATPNDTEPTPDGYMEPNQIGAWTIAIPQIEDRDLIYRTSDRKMYRVERVTPTELLTKPVRQIITLSELHKDNIVYDLQTRIDL